MKDPFEVVHALCNKGTNKEKYESRPDFPDLVDIELTNRCNMKCKMCPTGRRELTRKRGFMSADVFGKIMKELREEGTPIRFVRWGEPMMHPNFWGLLAIAAYCGLRIHVNTNGYYFDDQARKLFDYLEIDSVKVSYHEVNKRVSEGVHNLSALKKAHRHVSFTSDEPSCFFECELDKVSHYKTYWEGKSYPRLPNCPEVFNKLSINWDGTVSACCMDYDNEMLVGDVKEQSLRMIWNGKKMKDYQQLIAEDNHWYLPLCQNCYDLREEKT